MVCFCRSLEDLHVAGNELLSLQVRVEVARESTIMLPVSVDGVCRVFQCCTLPWRCWMCDGTSCSAVVTYTAWVSFITSLSYR